MRELDSGQPMFVGFELDGSMRRQIEGIAGSERKYVSADDTTFLSICRLGEHVWVGKLIEDRLTTSRVDDVRRNVLSILRRVIPDVRLPEDLQILPVSNRMVDAAPSGDEPEREERQRPPERAW